MPFFRCANCPHGKAWHEMGKGRCGYAKPRNSGGRKGKKGRCECQKFRAGEQIKTPAERLIERFQ